MPDGRTSLRTIGWLNPAINPLCNCQHSILDTREVEEAIWSVFPDYQPWLTMYDMDGVLVENWYTPEQEPEEVKEDDPWHAHVYYGQPYFLPSGPVLAVVSGRLECYRAVTMMWLNHYAVAPGALRLAQFDSVAERNRTPHALLKGRWYAQSKQATLFIESEEHQAQLIAETTHRPVFSMATMSLLHDPIT